MRTDQQINFCNSIFLLLGIFTTIQFLTIAGFTIFNIVLLFAAVIPILVSTRKLKVDKFFIFSVLATICTLYLSANNEKLTSSFKKSATMGGIIYLTVLVVYLMMNTKEKYANKLIKGFQLSCKLTLVWCVLQVFFFNTLHVDINTILFSNILKNSDARSDYFNGEVIPSGFYNHRAVLVPSLLFLFFSTSNLYLMLLIIIVSCLTRSTALIIGIFLALGAKTIIYNRTNIHQTVSKKKIILILSVIIFGIVGCTVMSSKISEIFGYVIMRLGDATTNKADNSSVVHFMYYQNLFPILQKINLKNVIFGTGFGTSGQHYTWFNGQYVDLKSWVVESDYINILLSQGVVGLILWWYVLIKILVLSKRYKNWKNIAFILIIAFVGIMYNIQFTWFIVVELGMLVLIKRGISIFNIDDKRKE